MLKLGRYPPQKIQSSHLKSFFNALAPNRLKKNFTSVYFKMAWLHVIYYVILCTSSNLLQRNIAKVCHINKKLMPEKTISGNLTISQSQLPLLLHLRVKIIFNEWQLLDTLKLLSSWFESVT